MAYGDSFGGVQAAQQNQQRARASDYFNSVAATRAQQAQDAQIAAQQRSYMLQQQQLGEASQARALAQRNREQDLGTQDERYALEYMTRLNDTGFNQDLQLENQDFQRARFDWDKENQAQRLLSRDDTIAAQGATFAADLGEATDRRKAAMTELERVQRALSPLTTKSRGVGISESYWNRKEPIVAELNVDGKAAARELQSADFLFKKALRDASGAGFAHVNGKLIHAKTGKSFDYLMTPAMTAPLAAAPATAPLQGPPSRAFFMRGGGPTAPVMEGPSLPPSPGTTYMAPAPVVDVTETVQMPVNQAAAALLPPPEKIITNNDYAAFMATLNPNQQQAATEAYRAALARRMGIQRQVMPVGNSAVTHSFEGGEIIEDMYSSYRNVRGNVDRFLASLSAQEKSDLMKSAMIVASRTPAMEGNQNTGSGYDIWTGRHSPNYNVPSYSPANYMATNAPAPVRQFTPPVRAVSAPAVPPPTRVGRFTIQEVR